MLGPFPPSAEIADGVHVYGNVQQSCLDPMTMAELARDPEYLESLGQLELVAYGGGALSPGGGRSHQRANYATQCSGLYGVREVSRPAVRAGGLSL